MGRTKHGTRITTADKIRADLKAQGYRSRKISVREPHHGDVTVTIRDAGVKLADIKAIADVYRHVRYCEASGEILLGGNTYVEVTYDRDVIRPYAELVAGLLAGIGQGYGISIGDMVLVWTHEPTSGHRTVSKVEGPGDLYRMYAGWGTSEPTAADFMGAAEEIARDLLGRGVEVKHNPRPAAALKAPLCVTCDDTGTVYTAGQVSVACPTCSPDPEPEPPAPAPEDPVVVETCSTCEEPAHPSESNDDGVCESCLGDDAVKPEAEPEAGRWKCLTCTAEGRGEAPARCPECDSERDDNHGPRQDYVLTPSACVPLAPFPSKERLASEIPFALAQAAHAGSSWTPERRAEQERESYAATLAADFEALAKYATTDEKMATLREEFDRYRAGYRKRYIAKLAADSRCMSSMITGPSNFPVARNRKRLDAAHGKLEDLLGYRERALAAIRKALRPELRPVMSGDGDAVDRLREKIAKAEAAQEQMREINAVIRKHAKGGPDAQVAALVALGYAEASARECVTPDFCGRVGIPSYQLSNNNANIRRMKLRLAEIERNKVAEVADVDGEHARLEDNPGDNRVRLYFPGKPSAEVRTRLKGAGFRWTPSLGCWQAYRNHRTIAVAKNEAGIAVLEGA